MANPGRPSHRLTREEASVVKKLLNLGWLQSRIAALFDVNIGRISEIKTGRTFSDVAPAP